MAVVDLRYARALAAVISDQKLDLIAAQGQLNDFANLLEESAELREVLQNPSIPERAEVEGARCDRAAPRLEPAHPQLHRADHASSASA